MSQPTPQRTRCSSAAPCGASSPSPPNPDSIDAITATRALLRISASVDRDSLHNQLASALILIDSSAADEDKLGVHACNRFASGIITVLLQARMRDPFARLPADIVQIVLEFFHPFSVAQFREVSRRWRDAGNVALSRARAVDLSPPEPFALFYGKPGEHGEGHAIPRTERRALAIRMMASHCRCVETLALVVDDDTHGFTKQEVVMALMAMPSVKALIVESRLRIPEFYPDSRPRICMTPEFRGMRPFCSSLRVLSLEFALEDHGFHIIAQTMPNLSALQLFPYGHAVASDQPLLSLSGLFSFIRQASNLRILRIWFSARLDTNNAQAQADPGVFGTDLHHLWLRQCDLDAPTASSILKSVGRELRSLVLRSDDQDYSHTLRDIGSFCPKLQHLSMDIYRMDAEMAAEVASLRNLQLLSTSSAMSDDDSVMMLSQLQAHGVPVAAGSDSERPSLAIQNETNDEKTPALQFAVQVRAEDIPVDLTPYSGLLEE